MEREQLVFDVVVVGAGPSGLSAAIKIKQLAKADGKACSVCLLDKGARTGAHLLSGAVMDPIALQEMFPDWQTLGAPLDTQVTDNQLLLLTKTHALALPIPKLLDNRGHFIVSAGALCRWLEKQAVALGVEVFPGFAVVEPLYDANGSVCGVVTGDKGLDKSGRPTRSFQRGIELHARQIIVAEGCRGSLTSLLFERFALGNACQPQQYSLGIKELWEVDPAVHQTGKVVHSIGWPLSNRVYGGAFLYHFQDNLIATGLIVGLDYNNSWLSPFQEFQRFKTHPSIRPLFTKGRRIAYGARALSDGGYQAIPKVSFPGGVLVGDAAGFLNNARLKGLHTAMKSGMIAARAVYDFLSQPSGSTKTTTYETHLQTSWLWKELYAARNVRPGFRWGLWPGVGLLALESTLWRGKTPWTLPLAATSSALRDKTHCQPIHYPPPDHIVTFDRNTSLALAHISHRDDQPNHVHLKDAALPITVNLAIYGAPETRYCPAGVFEIVETDGAPRLKMNPSNCLHCKTCAIMDPRQNIVWTVPEGGSGPHYLNM